jgi:UDP-glucose 4-epimerase
VTGAGGFIGAHVASELAARGWRVGVAGNPGRGCDVAAAAVWGALDAEALTALGAKLGAVTAIVHCAGGSSVGPSLRDPARDYERTVSSTLRVLEFMRDHAPSARLVFLSSAAVYGAANVEPLHEGMPKRPMSPYGAHKAEAEDLAAHWAAQYGFDVTALRLFSVYGAGLRKQLLWELSRRALAGESPLTLFGTGDERRDFIEIADAVALIARAADPALQPPAVMNGGCGRATSVREVAQSLLDALGCAPDLGFNGEVKQGDPTTMVADVSLARAFGFAPKIALTEGLARYATWARSEG